MKQLELTERQTRFLKAWVVYVAEADRWASNTERGEMLEVSRKLYNLLHPYNAEAEVERSVL